MGKVFSSFVKRPTQNWNIESRAHKVLDKAKPNVAPKHNQKQFEKFQSENPDYLAAQTVKNEDLHSRLSNLVVNPDKMGEIRSKSRPMPEERRQLADLEYGYKEPERIPEGRISIMKALELLNKNSEDPKANTAAVLAAEYKLKEDDCDNIVKHFHALMLHMPKDKDGKPLHLEGASSGGILGKFSKISQGSKKDALPKPDNS
ncbi:hypothetical protein CAPTEDRAFT_149484 [Capitella teleta]|uniref:Uncharacterized protein n=1 Tax=Capitella teleta TaxID=283909 RepID=R7UUS6_CAPTE|nr:hypothetical protein CAPTEDRAFT_149484 [Capitella teleta]|eukprot:ELU10393.1 hypothetical protein CAPTEDRAFT_149484 [Capitella teleta]